MKLQSKLITFLGGSGILAFLLFLLLAAGVFKNAMDHINQNLKEEAGYVFQQIVRTETERECASLEEKVRLLFDELKPTAENIRRNGEFYQPGHKEVTAFIQIRRDQNEHLESGYFQNTAAVLFPGKPGVRPLQNFLLNSSMVKTRTAVIIPEKHPEFLLIAETLDHGGKAYAFVVDIRLLLNPRKKNTLFSNRTVLFGGHNLSAQFDTSDFSKYKQMNFPGFFRAVQHKNISGGIELTPFEKDGQRFMFAAASLNMPSDSPLGIRLCKIYSLMNEKLPVIRISFDRHFKMTLILLLLCSLVIFLIPLIILGRSLALSVRRINQFTETASKGNEMHEKLYLDFSSDLTETAANLNYMRDKLVNLCNRLSRSHDREKKASQELEYSSRFRSALITHIMEEQGHPINTATGYAEIIMDHTNDPELKNDAASIHLSLLRLSHFQKTLADLARLDYFGSEKTLELQLISPIDILNNSAQRSLIMFQEKQISLEIRSGTGLPQNIKTDRNILTHAILLTLESLLHPAPKYSKIQLGCKLEGDQLEFWSSAEYLPEFRPFADLLKMRTENDSASIKFFSGEAAILLQLLCIQKELAIINAEMIVQTEENKINRIGIRFPLNLISEERPDSVRSSNIQTVSMTSSSEPELLKRKIRLRPNEKLRILILDLFPKERKMLMRLLQDQNYEIAEAASEKECFEQLSRQYFDMILIDAVEADRRTAIEFMTRLRKSQTGPMILIGMIQQSTASIRFSEHFYGLDALIEKPVMKNQLINVISSFIRKGE